MIDGSWRQLAEAPFGSFAPAGAWTGDALVVVDLPSGRSATYDMAADAWTELPARETGFESDSPWVWSGTEFFVFDGREAHAFDPAEGTWRELPSGPLKDPTYAVWADGRIVIGEEKKRNAALYDTATGAWAELPKVPGAKRLRGLFWTGTEVLGLTSKGSGHATVAALDDDTGEWGQPSAGPVAGSRAEALWTGAELLFVSGEPNEPGFVTNATYDPADGSWEEHDFDCPARAGVSVWADGLLVDAHNIDAFDPQPGYALDPATGECFELADPDGTREAFAHPQTPVLSLLAGDEIVLWSRVGVDSATPPDGEGISFSLAPVD